MLPMPSRGAEQVAPEVIDLIPVDRAVYLEQGYIHVPGVFTADEIAAMNDEAVRVSADHGDDRPWTGGWAPADTTHTLLVVPNLLQVSPLFFDAAQSPAMCEVIGHLIGPAQCVAGMLITKPPELGQPFPLHQDSAYYAQTYDDYVIATIHLDATTSENGALRFLPGGHAHGPLPHIRRGKSWLDPATYRVANTVEVCAAAGDVVCFNIHTPHCSNPNTTDRPRVTVRLGYIPRKADAARAGWVP